MENSVNLGLTFLYKEGYGGVLVGQCVKLPGLMVQGKTYDEIKAKMLKVLSEYLKKFPEEKTKILSKHGKIVDTKSWNKEQLVCTIDQ